MELYLLDITIVLISFPATERIGINAAAEATD